MWNGNKEKDSAWNGCEDKTFVRLAHKDSDPEREHWKSIVSDPSHRYDNGGVVLSAVNRHGAEKLYD